MTAAVSFADFGFADPEVAKGYAEGGPQNVVPGFEAMHRMAVQLISESAPADGRVLVLGAGGGLELKAFVSARPGWRLVGVDPSATMLAQAKLTLGADAGKVDLVEGYIADAPQGPFDGATCLLTLHFLPDDGAKLDALRDIRSRLKPGGRFALVDSCIDRHAPDVQSRLDRYARYALASGFDQELVDKIVDDIGTKLNAVTAAREEELLCEAGFVDIDLFYAGLSWRGWIASAP